MLVQSGALILVRIRGENHRASFMQSSDKTPLRIGEWRVDPFSGEITRNGETARLEVRTLRLLLCLAEHSGETVSIDNLLSNVWPEVTVTPDSVYQAMASLRRVLGDDPKHPQYIATVPRLGYRMLAPVSPWNEPRNEPATPASPSALAAAGAPPHRPPVRARLLWTGGIVLIGLLVAGYAIRHRLTGGQAAPGAVSAAQKSIAVLPFLDLTEGMSNEEFADGMTEELIDKLSKIPELRVPSPTSSFYFKNKRVALGEIAAKLGVVYLLDGSVRKSGARLRVAARLVRADNGYVMWSESYDRPVDDLLMVQDDIAGEVSKALKQSIEGRPDIGVSK
jgi:transcriptional activator of cad operon